MNEALKWKLIAGFILVFFAGAMTGFFFAAFNAHRVFAQFHQPGVVASRMKERLHSELSLTPEQMAKISPIVDNMAAQLEQIRMETGKKVHQTFMEAHREMGQGLNEEQRAKLEKMERQHRTFHGLHGGHGPPPGGPGEMPPPP